MKSDELKLHRQRSEKLAVTQLVKKSPALYGIRKFITVFVWTRSRAGTIQFAYILMISIGSA